jgi:hypothetical protein
MSGQPKQTFDGLLAGPHVDKDCQGKSIKQLVPNLGISLQPLQDDLNGLPDRDALRLAEAELRFEHVCDVEQGAYLAGADTTTNLTKLTNCSAPLRYHEESATSGENFVDGFNRTLRSRGWDYE